MLKNPCPWNILLCLHPHCLVTGGKKTNKKLFNKEKWWLISFKRVHLHLKWFFSTTQWFSNTHVYIHSSLLYKLHQILERNNHKNRRWINPLTLRSDSYTIHTLSGKKVMRILKLIWEKLSSWSNTKFSQLIYKEMISSQKKELQSDHGS